MNKPTTKQKEDLIEAFKGPHFYTIRLWGYGAETSYINISKEAHDFWKAHTDEHGDSDAVTYVIGAEDNPSDQVNEDQDLEVTIPREAMFMHNEEGEGSSFYEPWDQFDATWGVAADAAYLTIEKVDSADYGATILEEVIEHDELNDFLNKVGEDSDWEVEPYVQDHMYGDRYPDKGQHICQFMSSEKGTFYEAVIEIALPFDQNLLKFSIAEAPNGEDLVYAVEYDGVELDNGGGDTTGKGYYAYFYEQEY